MSNILELLENNRIFSLSIDDEANLVITEACDSYFSLKLTKSQVLELAECFTKLAEEL